MKLDLCISPGTILNEVFYTECMYIYIVSVKYPGIEVTHKLF